MRPCCIASIGCILAIILGLYFSNIAFFLCLCIGILIFVCYPKSLKVLLYFYICFIIFYGYISILQTNYNQIIEQYGEKEVKIKAIVVSDVQNKEYKDVYQIKVIEIENNTEKNEKIEVTEEDDKNEKIKVTESDDKNEIENKESKKVEKISFHLLCNIKKDKTNHFTLEYGDEITFKATYEIPSTARNESGFDYRIYLKTKQIAGTVTIKANDVQITGKNKINFITTKMNELKNRMIQKIQNLLPIENAGICIGLLLGDQRFITEEIKENFRLSNLSHMLAISGSHIAYLLPAVLTFFSIFPLHQRFKKCIGIVFLIFFMLLVGFAPSIVRACLMSIYMLLAQIFYKKSDVYQSLGISTIIILAGNPYALLDIGFQLSYGGTIGIVLFSQKLFLKRQKRDKTIEQKDKQQKNLTVKEAKQRAKQQKNVEQKNEKQEKLKNTQNGNTKNKEQKLVLKELIHKTKNNIKEMAIVSIAANLIIFPIMIYHFNTLSATFLISNILASPISAICLIVGLIFIVLIFVCYPLAAMLSYFLNPLLTIFVTIADFSSKLPFSPILLPTPKIWQIILYYIILFLIFSKWNRKLKDINITSKITQYREKLYYLVTKNKKQILLFCILLLLSPYIFINLPTNYLTISMIDVGQGDSILIQTPKRKTILIDGGGSELGSFDVGEKTLLPYLLDKNITKIDYMFFTHFDSDHCEGLFTILEKIPVENVIISKQGKLSRNFEKFLSIIQKNKTNIILVQAGDKIQIDKEVNITILFPQADLISENILNNNSIVAKLEWKNKLEEVISSILLTGDIEQIAEERLIEKYKNTNILKADILKVAHHGSKSSSIKPFLELVNPTIALIGVGENNNFGHPNEGVLQRLESLNTIIFRTDKNGEINLKIEKNRKAQVKTKLLIK